MDKAPNATELFCRELERMIDHAAETMTAEEFAEAAKKAGELILEIERRANGG